MSGKPQRQQRTDAAGGGQANASKGVRAEPAGVAENARRTASTGRVDIERSMPISAENAQRASATGNADARRTQQREAIVGALARGDRALSAQELHERLRAAEAGVGLATVYRNLGRLAEEGEIDAIRRPSGETAYRACASGHHHHLTCRTCGKVVELHDCTLADWSRRIAAEYGFEQVEHQAELTGICTDCH